MSSKKNRGTTPVMSATPETPEQEVQELVQELEQEMADADGDDSEDTDDEDGDGGDEEGEHDLYPTTAMDPGSPRRIASWRTTRRDDAHFHKTLSIRHRLRKKARRAER